MRRLYFPIVIGLVGTAILLWLGTWQVQRLAWKSQVLANIEARIAAEPSALPSEPDDQRDLFLPVIAQGSFAGDPLRVLVSVKTYGAGHRLISAFVTTSGQRIMVDRGYLRVGEVAKTPVGQVSVAGNLHWPKDADSYTPDPQGDLWFAREVAEMAGVLNTEPILIIARRLSPAEQNVQPLPVDTDSIPNDHLEYAITWYSLALIWVAMTGYWLLHNRARPDGTGDT